MKIKTQIIFGAIMLLGAIIFIYFILIFTTPPDSLGERNIIIKTTIKMIPEFNYTKIDCPGFISKKATCYLTTDENGSYLFYLTKESNSIQVHYFSLSYFNNTNDILIKNETKK